jgi:tetratricopeptide (TPR) repeat protein
VPSILALSTIRIDAGDLAIAEGFLDVATQTNAWDSPEAWYLLAKVYEKTRRQKRARECLLYALDLEETRPIRDLRHTLDRYL